MAGFRNIQALPFLPLTGGTVTGDVTLSGTDTQIKLPIDNDAVTPTIAFGDGDTGLYESSDDSIAVSTNGAVSAFFLTTGIRAGNSTGPMIRSNTSTLANVGIMPDLSDPDTGLTGQSGVDDSLSLVAGGVEMLRCTESTTDSVLIRADNAAVTDGDIPTSFVAVYLDEVGNTLTFRVRYSDGSTLKTGTVALT